MELLPFRLARERDVPSPDHGVQVLQVSRVNFCQVRSKRGPRERRRITLRHARTRTQRILP